MQILYHNKEWLVEARTTQGRTMQDIGDEFGVSRETIRVWCTKFGIPGRPGIPPFGGFETFLDYVTDRCNKGWLAKRIATESGRYEEIIRRHIRKSAVDVRLVRFYLRVDSIADDCWEWQGARDLNGYGRLSWHGCHTYAHRVAWELAYGPIPEGKQVLHECDNPSCCRPDHLFLGTSADNAHDRDMKGRGRAGLTPYDIVSIRRQRVEGKLYKEIAQGLDINIGTVGNICLRKTWDWVKEIA